MAYKLHFLMMIAIFESERFDTNLYYNKSRAATIMFLLFLKPAIFLTFGFVIYQNKRFKRAAAAKNWGNFVGFWGL